MRAWFRRVPSLLPSVSPGKRPGTIHLPVTFPWLDNRYVMAQSYQIVRSEYCCSPRQYQDLTAKPVS